MRLELFPISALERVPNGLFRSPQILRVQIAFGVEHFAVSQRDRRSRRSLHDEADPAHHVLAHVDDR